MRGGSLCARGCLAARSRIPGATCRGRSEPGTTDLGGRGLAGSGIPASPICLVTVVGDRLVHLREEVAVAVVCLLDGRVAEADLHGLGVGITEVDGERHGGVAEVVVIPMSV